MEALRPQPWETITIISLANGCGVTLESTAKSIAEQGFLWLLLFRQYFTATLKTEGNQSASTSIDAGSYYDSI
jgi:hypothetical protein